MNVQFTPPNGLDDWDVFHQAPDYLVPRRRILNQRTAIFAMGSCFAVELRTAFSRAGRAMYPDYPSVSFDPATQIYDKMPERTGGLTFFDTFTMRQEFESIFGLWADRAASFCPVHNAPANEFLGRAEVWQDPTRKMVYAATRELLVDLSDRLDVVMREGLAQSEVVVLTLGLTEVWRHTGTGRYLCMPPGAGYGGAEMLGRFSASAITQNYMNLRVIFDLIFAHYPQKQVVLSVSPVHLQRTFTGCDVGTASMESKSILRALAGQISREYENVTYFPAFEMAAFSKDPVFMPDGRHVTAAFAAKVVSSFLTTFSA